MHTFLEKILLGFTFLLFFSPSLAQFDRPALVDFYNAFNGANWINNTNWLSDVHHCEWFGIVCYDAGIAKVVVGFRLPLNNLEGSLPPNFFGTFPYLVGLDLSSNIISGTLDDSICKGKYLQYVELSLNIIGGTLPNCWTEASQVYYFSIRYNRFVGTFPETFGNLRNLTAFDLSENQLEGSIPDHFCMVNQTITYFFVIDNLFSGRLPECFGSFQKIHYLYFDANNFSGTIPESILRLNSTDSFSASGNNFEGSIPDVFNENQKLRVMWLGENNLTGNLPDSLYKLKYMVEFRCDYNRLEGEVPASWSQLVKTRTMVLAHNRLTGPFPSIPTLTFLNVQNNSLSGGVDFLTTNLVIQFLDLSHNNFSGVVPYNLIAASTEISHIALNNNNFSGPLFNLQVVKLAPVTYLDASYNQFSGQMSLAFLPQLTTFKINNNKMQGYIYAFGASDILTVMDYSNNQFIGPIPAIIGFITSLEVFKVDNNRLVGGIPNRIADLKKLKTFTCSKNQLQTSDLSVLAKIPSLEIVDISSNKINATLPETMGNLENLQYFDASDNSMSGTIPDGLFSIPNLATLNLANNNFRGTFSSLGGSAVLIDLSNNNFEGGVEWISSLTAIKFLSIRNNNFVGQVQDMSPNKQCSHLDLSNNQLNGNFPAISQLTKLLYMNVSYNQFQGLVPDLEGSNLLEVMDLSHNLLQDASGLSFLPSLTTCFMNSNSFECPVAWQAFDSCQAKCQVTPGGSSTFRLRVEGDLDSFDSDKFKVQISTIGNFTQSRLKILQLSSGSVIVDMEISPPAPDAINEGSSARVVEILTRLAQAEKGVFQQIGLNVLGVSDIPKETKSNQLSKGAIAGIAIALAVVFGILIAIMIVLYIRGKKRVHVTNQFAMIDVSSMNLGAAKKSIIPYSELSEMDQIGAGAFGIVYRAKWRELDVAVKQIRAEFVTEGQLKDFLQEVAILQGLRSHPNVVLFLAVTFPPEPLSMITELCEGGSLYQYLRENQVDLEQKKKFISGIALGMLHLHSEKIVHRDLAVRNILLTKHLEPKVADFGLSREQTSSESTSVTSSAVGPLKWMSPEAIQNRQYSTKSDSFSFGVCVWEILTVSDPFPEHTPMECAFMVVVEDKRLIIPSGTDPTLASIMAACWDRDPEARPEMSQIYTQLGGDSGKSMIKSGSVMKRQESVMSKSESTNYATIGFSSVPSHDQEILPQSENYGTIELISVKKKDEVESNNIV
eukprot:TRINITY_DN1052_c0_g1_i1.p1 TRINITY_DN1052_c0_g1~~TRINITY_DN1052_c0_g1_i1.p1  ORF type:complete len:1229 (+),score=344.14 TRINITY_DN1052_c0_g1_i1:112-3798(+)